MGGNGLELGLGQYSPRDLIGKLVEQSFRVSRIVANLHQAMRGVGSEKVIFPIDVYKGLFDKEPVVEAIHAGLECGIIGAKYEGMDMISFGPTIKNPHSPEEKLQISTVGQVYDFLCALLKAL